MPDIPTPDMRERERKRDRDGERKRERQEERERRHVCMYIEQVIENFFFYNSAGQFVLKLYGNNSHCSLSPKKFS